MGILYFVTWRELPGLAADDRLVASMLRERGHDVHAAAWDDPDVRWSAPDAIVVRSCWDYHLRTAEFGAWLDRLEDMAAPLWNPAALLRWNAHKGYLVELADRGLPVVPTELLRAGDDTPLDAILHRNGWDRAVVKPAVGASAWGARTVRPDDRTALGEWREQDLLVQPLVPEVATEGEWSLVYIGGCFSHAVRKRPGAEDFRVQHELGGSIEATAPPGDAVETAGRILGALAGPWLYARIDVVCTGDGVRLMEAELLEPSLFLDLDERAPARFADAIEATIRG